MAVYIVCGQDNCGKSTLIDGMIKCNANPKRMVLHSSSPPKGVNALSWAKTHYKSVLETVGALSSDGWDVYMDRAHIGECVYGPIYRGTSGDWVFELEDNIAQNDVFLITIVGTEKHLSMHDDGKSLSTDNWKRESLLFREAHSKSSIHNKLLVELDCDFNGTQDTVTQFITECENG